MKVRFAFEDWKKDGKSVYATNPELSAGDFQIGTVFTGNLDVDEAQEAEQRWTPYVGQLGSQFKVDSTVHVYAAEVSDRVPA